MSTFITGGNILLRVKSRFMLFSNDGAFIDELGFQNGQLTEPKKIETTNVIKGKQVKKVKVGDDLID